jgi:hypothetical protein
MSSCKVTLLVFILLIIVALPALSQSATCGVAWQNALRVSFDSTLSGKPQLAVHGDTIHLLWYGIDTLGTVANDGIQYSRSTDGGVTFSTELSILSYDQAPFPGFIASNGNNLYVVAAAFIDTFYGTAILRSYDAGSTWQPILPILRNVTPQCIVATDGEVYIHYSDQRTRTFGLLVSSDSGRTWSVRTSTMPGLDAMITASGQLHGVGSSVPDRTVEIGYYNSFDDGFSWGGPEFISLDDHVPSAQPSIAANSLGYLYAIWNDTGIIKLRRSRNAGFSWSPEAVVSTEKGAVFSAVAAGNEFVSVIWDNDFGGSGGIRFRSSNDYAGTFCPVESPTNFVRVGEPTVVIVGDTVHLSWSENIGVDGEILYRKGTLTENPDLDTKPPTRFALKQNYPNPFNGSTRIVYDIPQETSVQLLVYNVLGQVVATLVDEVQPVGRYNVEFSGNRNIEEGTIDLPTGMYFYRLRTGFFTETKKLLIVR